MWEKRPVGATGRFLLSDHEWRCGSRRKGLGNEMLPLKPGPALDTVIWKNGVSRSGKLALATRV